MLESFELTFVGRTMKSYENRSKFLNNGSSLDFRSSVLHLIGRPLYFVFIILFIYICIYFVQKLSTGHVFTPPLTLQPTPIR